jgi:hypothetical protein
VISKKKKIYRFSGRIRTFYRRKTDFYEKKNSVALPSDVAVAICRDYMAVHMKILSARFLKDTFTQGIGLTGVSFHFWPQKQIPSGSSHMNFWLIFHFYAKYPPI